MKRYQSYRYTVEQKKNIRKTFLLTLLTLGTGGLIFFFGVPFLAKFALLFSNIKKSSQQIESKDTTPPPPPSIATLPEAINKLRLEISGSAEPGSSVKVFVNEVTEETVANENGKFTTIANLNNGENIIYAISTDSSGNDSQKSKIYKVSYDNDAPDIEVTNPQDGAEFFGSKQRQVTIEGKTESGAALKINDRLVVVEDNGSFSFTTTLQEGENTFTINSQDKSGNSSEKKITLKYSS